MALGNTLKKTAAGAAGLAVAAFATAVYDYGFNEQSEVEKVSQVEITAEGGTRLTTVDGDVYQSWIGEGPPAGMFLRGGDFEITYTGGIGNTLFDAPRNPVMVQKASPQP